MTAKPEALELKSNSSLAEIKQRVEKAKRNGLSEIEVNVLAEKEQAIEQGGNQQVIIAEAFKAIRDLELWRGKYKSFRGYVKKRWPYEKSRVSQLTKFADVRNELREAIAAKEKKLKPSEVEDLLPYNENQVRGLFKLKLPKQRASAWMGMLEKKKTMEITGTDVRKIIGQLYPETIDQKSAKEVRNTEQEEQETDPIHFEVKIEDGVGTVSVIDEPGDRFSGTLSVCVCSYAEYERFLDALRTAEVHDQFLEFQKETVE